MLYGSSILHLYCTQIKYCKCDIYIKDIIRVISPIWYLYRYKFIHVLHFNNEIFVSSLCLAFLSSVNWNFMSSNSLDIFSTSNSSAATYKLKTMNNKKISTRINNISNQQKYKQASYPSPHICVSVVPIGFTWTYPSSSVNWGGFLLWNYTIW